MKASDASGRASTAGYTSHARSVAAGVDGDTCGTSGPVAVVMGPSVRGERGTAANDRGSVHRPRRAKRLPPRAHPRSQPLLDRDESPPAVDVGAIERGARWELAACLSPALEAARSSGLDLFAITLTAVDVETFRDMAERFAESVVSEPLTGVLLVHEVGEDRGRPHCHGIALARSVGMLADRWRELAGRSAQSPKVQPLMDWRHFCAEGYEQRFGPHLFRVVSYAIKPPVAGCGPRSLDRDYLASGSFAAPLRAFLARMRAPVLSDEEGASVAPEVSPTRRPCAVCGELLPAGRRSDMKAHRRCGQRHSKENRKRVRAEEAWKARQWEEAKREAAADREATPDD